MSKKIGVLLALLVCWGIHGERVAAEPVNPGRTTEADPIQPVNRGTFWFNDQVLYRWVLKPAGQGWKAISPASVRGAVTRFMDNLGFPRRFVNNFLQAEPVQSARELGRFVVNTTVGVAGFFDPATNWGLTKREVDFGQTLGTWGLHSGPYLVLPLFGSSNPRDTVGLAADLALGLGPALINPILGFALTGADMVNASAESVDDLAAARKTALDFYSFARNAYIQQRRARISGEETAPDQDEEDLYEFSDTSYY